MVVARLLTLLALIAASQRASAANPPVWQPYREPMASIPVRIETQQFVTASPQPAVPIDALTDAELDQLACCGESLATTETLVDPVIGGHWSSQQYSAHTSGGSLELLPSDVIWHSYWAGAKEPRMSGNFLEEFSDDLTLLDVTLGGRSALLRNASRNAQGPWYGWEVQIEGAAILRLNLDQDWDFESVDFRFGVPLIIARNQLHWKLAYYHLSSHVGDEFLVRNPGTTRINYSRDVLVAGVSYFPRPAWRWYAETGWAFYDDQGSDPWEFQFGLDLAQPGPTGRQGTPFLAINGHLREEVHFGGNLVVQGGWLWRGRTGRVLRTGLHYYNGKSPQFEFFDQFEQQLGIGLWQEY